VSTAPSTSAFVRGARLFDAGSFFDAHEAWEEQWRIETDPTERRFLQGLIQVAAALHKLLVVGSPEAASRLFARALAKLDACPADLTREEGFDLTAFRSAIHGCAGALAAQRFDRATIPVMLGRASPPP
jgi:predicted metal-dependent hydrolase